MKTKKAIEFCEYMIERNVIEGRNEKYREMVILLQQGEKYEKMWEELYVEYGMCLIRKNDEEGYMSNILYKILEELQQKYFPKESMNEKINEEKDRR